MAGVIRNHPRKLIAGGVLIGGIYVPFPSFHKPSFPIFIDQLTHPTNTQLTPPPPYKQVSTCFPTPASRTLSAPKVSPTSSSAIPPAAAQRTIFLPRQPGGAMPSMWRETRIRRRGLGVRIIKSILGGRSLRLVGIISLSYFFFICSIFFERRGVVRRTWEIWEVWNDGVLGVR